MTGGCNFNTRKQRGTTRRPAPEEVECDADRKKIGVEEVQGDADGKKIGPEEVECDAGASPPAPVERDWK